MSGDQWKAVYDFFEAASSLPPAERRHFLSTAVTDPEVRSEVLAMLDEASTPVEEDAQAKPEWPRLGQQLGRFTITNTLGRGGMGEVYSAHDTELNRTVALKFLSFETSGDGRAAERFIREARAASALNHPNIVTVHEVLRVPPTFAIVMELIEGVALRQRCGKPNPVEQVVHWGRQIAEALAAAHAAGIVHRDIKPENVMLRPDGYTKVLDFGLARQFSHDQSSASVTAGTFRYMSPEQTRGAKLTAATDVFSLGIMLYELATGAHPFAGESPLETAHFISSRDAVSPSVSKTFDALILSMLRKAPEERPSAAEVARRLAAVTMAPDAVPAKRKIHRGVWLGVALVSIAVLVLVVASLNKPGTSKQPASPIQAKKLWGVPLTDLTGHEGEAAFSPDGSRVAYAWDRADNPLQRDIFIKRIGGGGDPEPITRHEADESGPKWSADGTQLAFLRHSTTDIKLVVAPVAGGSERIVASLYTEGPKKPRLTWSPDGQSLVIADDLPGQSNHLHLFRLDLRTGDRTILTKPSTGSDVSPAYSPDGKTIAFMRSLNVTDSHLYVLDATGHERQLTTEAAPIDSFSWDRDSTALVYAAGLTGSKDLWRAALDGSAPQRLPFTLAGSSVTQFTMTPAGRRLAYTVGYKDSNIWRIDTSGSTRPRKLTMPEGEDEDASYSPDGAQFAFTSKRSGFYEIWAGNADGSNQRPLTTEGVFAGSAVWSPDGSEVAYDARIGGFSEIWIVSSRGGKPRRLIEPPIDAIIPFWSRDGRWIYFCAHISGSAQIWKVPASGGKPIQVTRQGGLEGRESFDGKYLYYSKPGEVELWRMALAGGGEEKITEIGSLGPFRYWDLTSKGIYFVKAKPKPMLHFFDFETRRIVDIATPPKPPSPGWRGLAAAPDGKSVLYVQYDADRHEIVIGDGFH